MTMTIVQEERRRKKKTKQPESSTIEDIFQWAKTELIKAADLFTKRKSEIILETAEKLKNEGIKAEKISTRIAKGLEGYVTHAWICEVLQKYPEYKVTYRVENAKKGKSSSTSLTKREQNQETEQSQEQEHMSNTSTNGDEPVKQTPRRLSVNQEAQILTTTEGRMGYVNEEHECFKDDIIKQLESEIAQLKKRLEVQEEYANGYLETAKALRDYIERKRF